MALVLQQLGLVQTEAILFLLPLHRQEEARADATVEAREPQQQVVPEVAERGGQILRRVLEPLEILQTLLLHKGTQVVMVVAPLGIKQEEGVAQVKLEHLRPQVVMLEGMEEMGPRLQFQEHL